MKSLYICNTPFQVMTAIFLKKTQNKDADLLLVNSFSDAKNLKIRIEQSNVFSTVKLVDETLIWKSKEKNLFKKRLSTVNTYINLKKIVEYITPNILEYSDLFVANRAAINRLFCMYVAEFYEKCEIHYFDDGIGTYDGSVIDVKGIDSLLRKVLIGKKAATFTYDSYLYSPALYNRIYPNNDKTIYKIQTPIQCEELETVFNFELEDQFHTRKILFDILPETEFDDYGRNNYLRIAQEVVEMGDCTVKPHPRATTRHFHCDYFEKNSVPFEVLCYRNNFTDNILITNFSSSVFTPKLLFGQEPCIIFLYKFNQMHRKNGKPYDDSIIELFKNFYTRKRKIFVPQDEKELFEILTELQ